VKLPLDLRLDPPRIRGDEPAWKEAWRRYRLSGALIALGVGWYASDSLRHRREGAFGYDLTTDVDVTSTDFLRAAEALTGAPISEGNRADLLINGDRIFPVFLETIRSAERTLNVQTYIYWRGEIADEVARAIRERAEAGVKCNVILDALGAVKMNRGLFDQMERAGVRVIRFRPPKPYAIRRVVNRTHRRLLIADGRVGMTGGVGIAAEWMGDAEDADHWRDTHVRVEAPSCAGCRAPSPRTGSREPARCSPARSICPTSSRSTTGGRCSSCAPRPRSATRTSRRSTTWRSPRRGARSSSPPPTSSRARPSPTRSAARPNGVDVRILVPGPHIDKGFVRIAGRAAYEELLDAGVRLFEYQPTMLHAKSLVVDGTWSSVGTVNFDNRSFQLHDEVTLCVWDERFAGELHDAFERDLERSAEIERGRWDGRGALQRGREAAMKPFRREL